MKILAIIVLIIAAAAAGFYVGQRHAPAPPQVAAKKQLWTCSMHPQVLQDHPGNCPICGMALEPVKESAAAAMTQSSAVIHIDPVMVQNMGVRLAEVVQGPLTRSIRATGILAQPTPLIHEINPRVSGWIEKLYADTEGMRVRKDDPLFDLYSPELTVAIEELIGAADMADLSAAARRKLVQWGLSERQIDELARMERAPRTVSFLSPADGEVTEKRVVAGAMIKAGEPALRLADRSRLWLDVQVYPMDLQLLRAGQEATIQIEGVQDVRGRVESILPLVSGEARTVTARVIIENADLRLRPGEFATVNIIAPVADKALLVPREAIIDTGTRQVAFVALPDSHFEPRQLHVGPVGDDGRVQVLHGLRAGEQIVVSGQFLLDAESRMKEAIRKHQSAGLPGASQSPAHDHAHH